jgi:hypothetical protein
MEETSPRIAHRWLKCPTRMLDGSYVTYILSPAMKLADPQPPLRAIYLKRLWTSLILLA